MEKNEKEKEHRKIKNKQKQKTKEDTKESLVNTVRKKKDVTWIELSW